MTAEHEKREPMAVTLSALRYELELLHVVQRP
jgi:hypothetical protein